MPKTITGPGSYTDSSGVSHYIPSGQTVTVPNENETGIARNTNTGNVFDQNSGREIPNSQGSYTPPETPAAETPLTEEEKKKKEQQGLRDAREADYQAGLKRGKELFTPESLGRMNMDTNKVLQNQRELGQAQLNRTNMAQQKMMAAAQAKSRLPAAAGFAQRAAVMRQQQLAQQDLTRQQQLDAYGKEKEQTQYNIGQKNKELFGQLATALSEQGFGVSERGYSNQSDIAKAMAEAAKAAGSSGGKK